MRQLESYTNEYGRIAGPIIFKLLKKVAAQAHWKAKYKALAQPLAAVARKKPTTRHAA